jgi:ABC-type thiamin/hydroxymethylpyrimidine transport system permease subunit
MTGSDDARGRSRLALRDLVLVALLAAVGGVLSTYIGYIGNLINRFFGVPFGAGQLIAGLHIVWPLLARSVVRRFGAGTLTGVTKGIVEFFAGGTHGVVIVLISSVEGLLIDLGMGTSRRQRLPLTMLVGAVASASNVFVFQAIYFSGVSAMFILIMAGLSAISGALFGGYLAWDLRRLLEASRLLPRARTETSPPRWRRHAVTALVVLALLGSAVYYYVAVYDPFSPPGQVSIEGSVEEPFTFSIDGWDGEFVTVTAELRGSVSYVPATDYTGVLLRDAIGRARPIARASRLRVVSEDGHEVAFDLDAVWDDEALLLASEGEDVRLVAAAYDGSLWVRWVKRVVVE